MRSRANRSAILAIELDSFSPSAGAWTTEVKSGPSEFRLLHRRPINKGRGQQRPSDSRSR